jgi:hypothetical protein
MKSKALTCEQCQKTLYLYSGDPELCVCPYCGNANRLTGFFPELAGLIPEMMSQIMIGTHFIWKEKDYLINGRMLFLCDNGYIMLWYAISDIEKVWLYECNQDYAVIESVNFKGQSNMFKGKNIGGKLMYNKEKYNVGYYDTISEIYVEGEVKSVGVEKAKIIVNRSETINRKVILAFIIDKAVTTILEGQYSNPVELKLTNTRNANAWNF